MQAIETFASDAMKFYGLPFGQELDRRYDMAIACSMGLIILAVQVLALG